MRRALLVALLLLGCRERPSDIHRAPERELPRTPPPPMPSATVTSLMGYVGDEVTVLGRVDDKAKPRIPWTVSGKSVAMVDLTTSHSLIAAHVRELPSCAGDVVMTGIVIVARGMIRQGTTEGAYAEPQLDVNRWNCR
jgi:hypothetical protein